MKNLSSCEVRIEIPGYPYSYKWENAFRKIFSDTLKVKIHESADFLQNNKFYFTNRPEVYLKASWGTEEAQKIRNLFGIGIIGTSPSISEVVVEPKETSQTERESIQQSEEVGQIVPKRYVFIPYKGFQLDNQERKNIQPQLLPPSNSQILPPRNLQLLLPSNIENSTNKPTTTVPPSSVLEVYKAHTSLIDVLSRNQFDNALLLLKYHLFKPDDEGKCCIIAVQNSNSLELTKLCLPDRQFLRDNPKYLETLRECALKRRSGSTSQEITMKMIEFLSDKDGVKDCPERDLFLREQFAHEMEKEGIRECEYTEDLAQRLSKEEINSLIERLPLEARRILRKYYSTNRGTISIVSSAIGARQFEEALLMVKYKMFKPFYYGDYYTKFRNGFGTCLDIMEISGEIAYSKGNNFLFELIKHTFPSQEYRNQHPERLQEFLASFAFQCAHFGKYSDSKFAIEIFQFLIHEGLNLEQIAKTSRPEVRKFLEENQLL